MKHILHDLCGMKMLLLHKWVKSMHACMSIFAKPRPANLLLSVSVKLTKGVGCCLSAEHVALCMGITAMTYMYKNKCFLILMLHQKWLSVTDYCQGQNAGSMSTLGQLGIFLTFLLWTASCNILTTSCPWTPGHLNPLVHLTNLAAAKPSCEEQEFWMFYNVPWKARIWQVL